MNKYKYVAGVSALALVIGAMPLAALAERGGGEDGQGDSPVAITAVSAQVGSTTSGERVRPSIKGGEQEDGVESEGNASSTEGIRHAYEQANENAKHAIEKAMELAKEGFPFFLEGTTTPVTSLEALKKSIEERKQELDDEEASSTPDAQEVAKNANPVRLAVHALLASKDILGGIGGQVSQIAQQMNDSIATTTAAQADIQSRGFLTRLFFGGDKASANALNEAISQNAERIASLTTLLNQASTTADVKATIEAQIAAFQTAQTNLQALAAKEQSQWGIFSWRF